MSYGSTTKGSSDGSAGTTSRPLLEDENENKEKLSCLVSCNWYQDFLNVGKQILGFQDNKLVRQLLATHIFLVPKWWIAHNPFGHSIGTSILRTTVPKQMLLPGRIDFRDRTDCKLIHSYCYSACITAFQYWSSLFLHDHALVSLLLTAELELYQLSRFQLLGINLQQASTPGTASYGEHILASVIVALGGALLSVASCIPKLRTRYWFAIQIEMTMLVCFFLMRFPAARPLIGMVSAAMATFGLILYWILALYAASFQIPGLVERKFTVWFSVLISLVKDYQSNRIQPHLWWGPSAIKN